MDKSRISSRVERVQKSLPRISQLLKKAQRLREKIGILIEMNDVVLEVNREDGMHFFMTDDVMTNKEFHRLYYLFYKSLEELQSQGAIVCDIDSGEVEFPFDLNGKEGFLCWQLGERKINFWRDGESDEKKPLINLDEFLV